MIGPPGLPKAGRPVFRFALGRRPPRPRFLILKWVLGLYVAGVLAHFSHHLAWALPAGIPFDAALSHAPVSLVWPADLVGTLIALG